MTTQPELDGLIEDRNERATMYERWLLSSILLAPTVLSNVTVEAGCFLLSEHYVIFTALSNLADRGEHIDLLAVADEMQVVGQRLPTPRYRADFDYLAALMSEPGIVPECVERYSREVKAAHRERQFQYAKEQLETAGTEEKAALLATMQELIGGRV